MVVGLVIVLVFGIGGIVRSGTIKNPSRGGATMGTGYSIKIAGKVKETRLTEISEKVESTLKEVNRQMSTWDPESEISRFNHSGSLEAFPCSEAFSLVVRNALDLSQSTSGAFDPTLQPLLNLWGFGSEAEERTVPSDAAVANAMQMTGWSKVTADDSSNLWKSDPNISLALGAIAKGYGVDAVGQVLDQAGLQNWFVEIGGEVLAKGVNGEKNPWRIGIQFPTTNPMDFKLQGIVHVTNGAIATSGDYRNYIQEGDTIYSHILDPRTGRAVKSRTASVTVLAPTCMEADGIATALFVMGPEEGLPWVEQRNDVEAFFMKRASDGEIIELFSSGFKEATGYTSAL